MVRYCNNCGTELDEGSVFCDECGARVDGSPNFDNNLFKSYKIDMMDGESVIRKSQIHSGCLLPPAIVMGVGFLIGFIMILNILRYIFDVPFFVVIFLLFNVVTIVGLVWLIIRYVVYVTNDLILTNKRVFGKCGLITTTQMQSPLNKIDSVSYSNGPIGKLIGYGTVKIATTSSNFKFRFITEGQTFYNDIFNQLEASEEECRAKDARAIADAIVEKSVND